MPIAYSLPTQISSEIKADSYIINGKESAIAIALSLIPGVY
ncbi:hypothetical protein [Nostoc sp. KVJ20]|nr:hypothetical protein [Nostoc sp. KVJ20]